MLPSDLKPEHFSSYPPLARKLLVENIAVLRVLPLSMLPGMLAKPSSTITNFPSNAAPSNARLHSEKSGYRTESQWLAGLRQIQMSGRWKIRLGQFSGQFVEQMSAHLWSPISRSLPQAAVDYVPVAGCSAVELPFIPRIASPLSEKALARIICRFFSQLRPAWHVTTQSRSSDGMQKLLAFAAARSTAKDDSYSIGTSTARAAPFDPALKWFLTICSNPRGALSKNAARNRNAGMGRRICDPRWRVCGQRFGLDKSDDPILARFQLKLLTEGSGTQNFQHHLRAVVGAGNLRRAQPLTLVVRFSPRQRQRR